MNRRQRTAGWISAAWLLLALVGCEEPTGAPGAAAPPAAPAVAPSAAAEAAAEVSGGADSRTAAADAPAAPDDAADKPAAKKLRPPRGRSLPTFGDGPPRELAAPARQPLVKKAGQADQITFDTLKFEMEKGGAFQRSMLTDKIEGLAGKKVELRGYILPSFQQEGIKQFVLVRDNMECCFGPGAALYDCVIVDMRPPHTAKYTVRPITVVGIFNIDVLVQDGETLAIYHLDGESAQ